MTSRVQTLRSSVAGARPAAGSQPPGELYVNWPDLQIGVIDASKNPQDLVAVRFFSATTSYHAGDIVVEGGHMWHANTDIPAGPFNSAQWDQNTVNPSPDGYLPLSGGTMLGALELAGDPTGGLEAATKEYVDLKLPLAGGTMTGDLVLYGSAPAGPTSAVPKSYVDSKTGNYLPLTGGTLAGPGNLTVNGALTGNNGATVTGEYLAKGPNAAFMTYDRGNSGGNTAELAGLYRDGNFGRLWMQEAGDVLQMSTAGNATFVHALTVNAGMTANSTLSVAGELYGVGASFSGQVVCAGGSGTVGYSAGTGYAAMMQGVNGSQAAFISYLRPGVYGVNVGIETDNSYRIGGWSMGNASYRIWHEGILPDPTTNTYLWNTYNAWAGGNYASFAWVQGNYWTAATTNSQDNAWAQNVENWAYGTFVNSMRLAYISDLGVTWPGGNVQEPYGGGIVTGWSFVYQIGVTAFRFRALQYTIGGGWYQANYA